MDIEFGQRLYAVVYGTDFVVAVHPTAAAALSHKQTLSDPDGAHVSEVPFGFKDQRQDIHATPGGPLYERFTDYALRGLHDALGRCYGVTYGGVALFGELLVEMHKRRLLTVKGDK